ncbi:hypothetical protein FOE78_11210 [Microlunatus elymi]|uniref:Uncharacterized protein n=1 Tax=Microlunatus elymi TaxID=2596828 RepID=A0A516PZ02_9ACTN|nr:Rv3235 family protein [Microlunatus elymi]QDP96394.1 hypothetical protein FOE78_11210 [Microlunatus elymi]
MVRVRICDTKQIWPMEVAMTAELIDVAMLPVPDSVPAAVAWPREAIAPPLEQQPLPWATTAEQHRAGWDRSVQHRSQPQVRILRFGDSWAPGLPPGLPDPGPWCVRLASALLEAVHGLRPVTQLNRWLDPVALTQLNARVRRRSAEHAVLRSVHVSRSSADAVEAVAVFGWARTDPAGDGGSAFAALAFRLEARPDRWMCTRLDTRALNRRG